MASSNCAFTYRNFVFALLDLAAKALQKHNIFDNNENAKHHKQSEKYDIGIGFSTKVFLRWDF